MVLYLEQADVFIDLNGSGALVWSLLESSDWSLRAVADELARIGRLSPDVARSIVDDFVDDLVRRGALVH
jgi:hypothetical protein